MAARNHARETEIWLRIYKKSPGMPTITSEQALDVVVTNASRNNGPDERSAGTWLIGTYFRLCFRPRR